MKGHGFDWLERWESERDAQRDARMRETLVDDADVDAIPPIPDPDPHDPHSPTRDSTSRGIKTTSH